MRETVAVSNSHTRILVAFFILYFFLWAVVPGFVLHSVFPDSAENLALSHVFSWSYNKHPPLGMFTLHFFNLIFERNELACFIASVSCLLLSLYVVYKISLRYLSQQQAVAATIISSLSVYFLVRFVLNYNQNTIMLPFWVASIYFFLKAMDNNRLSDWLCLGVICFLGMMAKYQTAWIMGIECLYLLFHFNKKYLPGLFLALLLFSLLMLPHLAWLYQHHFPTIKYLIGRSGGDIHHRSQLKIFLETFAFQPLRLIVAGLMMAILVLTKRASVGKDKPAFRLLQPLIFFSIMPWALLCVLSLFVTVKTEWGYPMLILMIPALFYQFNVRCHKVLDVLLWVGLLQILISGVYLLGSFMVHRYNSINRPSYQLAQIAQQFWQQHGRPLQQLKFVGGGPLDDYLTAYLPTKPKPFKGNSFKQSPWISKQAFYRYGALFLNQGCEDKTAYYQQLGFRVVAHQCFVTHESNKFKPTGIPVSLYLIAPGSEAAS